MTCQNCLWYVNENGNLPDEYKHELALRDGKGFCLMQDLFTYVNPKQKECKDFNFDGVKEDFELIEMFEGK